MTYMVGLLCFDQPATCVMLAMPDLGNSPLELDPPFAASTNR